MNICTHIPYVLQSTCVFASHRHTFHIIHTALPSEKLPRKPCPSCRVHPREEAKGLPFFLRKSHVKHRGDLNDQSCFNPL